MSDTPTKTPSLIESDLAAHHSTNPMPTSLPRFEGIISCASPTATLPTNLSERRKKFRKARLDIHENVTVQIANTPKLKHEAAQLLKARYRSIGFETSFLDNPTNTTDERRLILLAKEGTRVSGTCSLMLDQPGLRLSADQSHEDYLNGLRQEGKCLIELCRLSTASELTDSTGRVALAAMFSYNVLCINYFLDYQPFLIIEVTPRHVDYWSSLGFEVLVEKKWCERINAYVTLLGCDWLQLWQLVKVEWQQPLRRRDPKNQLAIAIRRFVRHFMPWEDVEGINRRIIALQDKNI